MKFLAPLAGCDHPLMIVNGKSLWGRKMTLTWSDTFLVNDWKKYIGSVVEHYNYCPHCGADVSQKTMTILLSI